MKFTAVIIYVNYLVIVASVSSTEENAEKGRFLGFELIEYRLQILEEKISNSFDRLVGFVSKIQNNTEERLNDLKTSVDANNYTLSTSLKRLENTAITNQKLSDEKSLSMKADISKLSDSLKRLESTFIAKQKMNEEKANNIKTDTSKLLERIAKLETLDEKLTKNQKLFTDQNEGIMLNLSLVANNTRQIIKNQPGVKITSCKEPTVSGVFQMQNPKLKVYCETDSFDGGWLVIQQRVDHTLSFNRSWIEYQAGFGTVGEHSDFWLGLEAIHQITKGGSCELVVEMKNNLKVYEYARYSKFIVAGEDEKYKLTVGGHSGTAGDQFILHNSYKFTTFDNDNDDWDINCALRYGGGGWWYNYCYYCNLNRLNGGMWSESVDDKNKLAYSRMMIRCR